MPFANLPTHEKDAFFALLDEYFTSRPDLLSHVGGAGTTQILAPEPTPANANTAATSAISGAAQRAVMANPAAASRMLAAGISRASSSPSASGKNHSSALSSAAQRAVIANPVAASRMLAAGINHAGSSPSASGNHAAASNNNNHASVGRVAAAAQAFSGSPPTSAPPPPKSTSPPVAGKLIPQKKFGDVDVSSAGGMFRSLRGSTAAKNAPPPTVYTPPAFAGKKASSGLPPPPVRRVSAAAAPEPEPEEEEEAGEWAEALYDYTSEEAGDLHLQAGEMVLVTEKTSSDWWTGEVDGRSGLFPVSYVKLL